MELEKKITGFKLVEIQKGIDLIKLAFENELDHNAIVLSFKGYLFETNISVLNRKVEYANLRKVLGFKAVAQLRFDHQDISKFQQLLIQMEGTDDENKIELIAVFNNYSLSEHKFSPAIV